MSDLADVERTMPRSGGAATIAPFLEAAGQFASEAEASISCGNTLDGLDGSGIECPRLDTDLLRRYLGQLPS